MTSLKDKDGNWLFIVPINGLELTKSANREITVNRVTFISGKKIPHIRKRLGLPYRISDIASQENVAVRSIIGSFYKDSETYAILRSKGKPIERDKDKIRLVRDELNILAFSQLGYTRRRFIRRLNIRSGLHGGRYKSMYLNVDLKEIRLNNQTEYSPLPLVIDSTWIKFHKKFFYFDLMKIIRGEIEVKNDWRATLHRAAIFAGQSQNTSDIPSAFLWNIIALEMLLADDESDQKISTSLIDRSEYLLGWQNSWEEQKFPERIQSIYKTRSDYVHKGKTKAIGIEDLLFSDDLVFNIINNLIRCKDFIQNKQDLIEHSAKYKAEKILGVKHKSRFNRMQFIKKEYSKEDLEGV